MFENVPKLDIQRFNPIPTYESCYENTKKRVQLDTLFLYYQNLLRATKLSING